MRAYFAGQSVQVQSENPIDDVEIRDALGDMPRCYGTMPDDSLAIALTRTEAWRLARDPVITSTYPLFSKALNELIGAYWTILEPVM